MNLKDAVLSTIDEIEKTSHVANSVQEEVSFEPKPFNIKEKRQLNAATGKLHTLKTTTTKEQPDDNVSPILQEQFLQSLRERILVLFEGFQSPNNTQLEAKIDLTLNFLEHLLAQIDNELEKIKRGSKNL